MAKRKYTVTVEGVCARNIIISANDGVTASLMAQLKFKESTGADNAFATDWISEPANGV
jgi:phosphomevalonate kinase|tara:strand:- start:102 stop:278 length:177 start_codon:yes stop_codon:yes gene_type:complete